MRATDAAALAGYAVAAPFVVWMPLFRRMWHGDGRLLALHELGVVLIVAGWAARGETPAVVVNAGWGSGLAIAYVLHRRRRARR